MSANYWASSQRANWQFSRDQLNSLRFKILLWEKQKLANNNTLSVRYDVNMRIFLHQMVAKLGRRLSLRQSVLATAEVYISRFLTKVSLLEINVYMLVATCVYIACKICESPQHIRTILGEARNCWPEFISGDFTKLAEFEFYLIEELDCYLIIYHPYNSLKQLVSILGTNKELKNNSVGNRNVDVINEQRNCIYRLDLSETEIENAWQVINDSYMTDLPLLYPPHIIAIAALHMTLILSISSIESVNEARSESRGNIRDTSSGYGNESDGIYNVTPTNKNGGNSSVPNTSAIPNINSGNISSNNSTIKNKNINPNSTSLNVNMNPQKNITNNSIRNESKPVTYVATNSGAMKNNSNNRTPGTTPTGMNPNYSNNVNNIHQSHQNHSFTHGGSIGLRRKLSQSLSHNGRLSRNSPACPSISPEKNNYNYSYNNNLKIGNNMKNEIQNERIQAFTNFLAGSNVNLVEVIESVQELLTLYESWQLYDEGAIRQSVKTLVMTLHGNSV